MRRKVVTVLTRHRGLAGFSLFFMVCLLGASLPPSGSRAQSQSPTPPAVSAAPADINKEGFRLKPVGLGVEAWPTARFDFSVERKDQSTGWPIEFVGLKAPDIQVKLDGRPVNIKDSDLKLLGSEPSSVLLLVDGSGSMVDTKVGFNKLAAAKRALTTFAENLRPNDRVALAAFDDEPYIVASHTASRSTLLQLIENFSIRSEKSHFLHTRLYSAVEFAVHRAAEDKIRNVIVISDGWEDTPETDAMSATALEEFKRRRERSIAEYARGNGIRVFTIAIGDEYGKGLDYVDRTALANVSKGANGGEAVYIDIPDLKEQAGEDEELYQELLLKSLTQTLEDIQQSVRYSYSLNVGLGAAVKQDYDLHTIWIAPTVGSEPRIQLPVEYKYTWLPGTALPEVNPASLKQPIPIFIAPPPETVKAPRLAGTYLSILALLAVLALIPFGMRLAAGGGRSAAARKAIVLVGARSELLGKECQNEIGSSRYRFKEGDAVVICPNTNCKAPHHLSCWHFNHHRCMRRVCQTELEIPQNVLSRYGLSERELSTA